MYVQSPVEYKLKKARAHGAVMEQIARGDHLRARRREFGTQYRQQIHTISGSFGKTGFGK
jgi:hypothetical protein